MVGGALAGTVGTQQGLATAGGAVPTAGDGVFGPGVIGGWLGCAPGGAAAVSKQPSPFLVVQLLLPHNPPPPSLQTRL